MKIEHKRKRFFVGAVGLTLAFLMNAGAVFAYDTSKEFDAHDISTWQQDEDGFPENTTLTLGTSSKTVSQAGCGYYAVASMLVKAGTLDPEMQSPIDVVLTANSGDNTDCGGWHFDMTKIDILDPDLECVDAYLTISGYSTEDYLAYIEQKYNEGYFIIVDVSAEGVTSGHYVFIDSFSDGEIYITDSKYEGIKWSDTYGQTETTVKYLHLFRSRSGKKCNELESVYAQDGE